MRSITLLCALALVGVALVPDHASAASKAKIDKRVTDALATFHEKVDGSEKILGDAAGYLVFPRVVKAGIGIGGETGEGVLIVGGKTVDYYRTSGGSIGLQLGAQAKSIIIVFLTPGALDKFQNSSGWKVGLDASVAIVDVGAGKSIDTDNIKDPVVGFVIDSKGLMGNFTFEGSKITKIDKS